MNNLKELQRLAHNFSILYVEDNEALSIKVNKLLKKFFSKVYIAKDGLEGVKLFDKYHPSLVVTDIKMPKMNGMDFSKYIKNTSADTKVIVMSAFDDKDYLLEAIKLGIFRFIKKPVNIKEFSDVLFEAIVQIKHERRVKLFQSQLGKIFDNQSTMIVMLKNYKPIIANQPFLDFYGVSAIDELNKKYDDIGEMFLEHDGFLYNISKKKWLDKILENRRKIFNVKMIDKEEKVHHFVLKCQDIPDKKNYGILSFDDVTDLNLMELFDSKITLDDDEFVHDSSSLLSLLEIIKRNNIQVSLHNYYKGLSITHDASIINIKENAITVETSIIQLKAIDYEDKCLIVADTLPYSICCENILNIAYDQQSVTFNNMKFVQKSAIMREMTRIVPEDTHTVELFMDNKKYNGEVYIQDITLNAIKVSLNALPAGLDIDEVQINLTLTMDNKPLNINTKATLYRKTETKTNFDLVFLLELSYEDKEKLTNYITKRQMEIIREFKGKYNENIT